MRSHRVLIGLVLFGSLFASRAMASGSVFSRFLVHDVEVVTVTDMTEQGHKLRLPTRSDPIYYEALVQGFQDVGRSVAGEHIPDKRQMLKLILKLLADQGYVPANAHHEPQVLLAIGWGTLNNRPGVANGFMGGDKLDIMWELEPLSIQTAARHLTRHMRSATAEFVADIAANSPLYIISIQAFDEAAGRNGRTELLWHTKVSCPSIGLDLPSTLEAMARQAAPYFGRETVKPVWNTAPLREGHVNIGELKVLSSIDPDKLPITDVEDGPDAIGASRRAEPAKQ